MAVDADGEHRNWLEKIISSFLHYREELPGTPYATSATPDEMIEEAAGKAFRISTALGLVPGPIGFFGILPEVVALTKLQIDLVCRIARYYHKTEAVDKEIVLLILANAMGVAGGGTVIRKAGTALVVKSANTAAAKALARRIGTRVIDAAVEKAVGRWIPVATAPLFGCFSRSLTRRIGMEAKKMLSPRESKDDYGDARGLYPAG